MLRNYDSIGLVSPTGRTHGGYREYAEEDVRRLFYVEGLRSLGLSLRDVATALDDPLVQSGRPGPEPLTRTRERLAREQELAAPARPGAGERPGGLVRPGSGAAFRE